MAQALTALAITLGVGLAIILIGAAISHDAGATYCERCRCAQSEHRPEFGFGGECRCGRCARFVLTGSWWTL